MQIGKILDITDPEEIAKRRDEIIELQIGGWLVESHCWNLPDNDGFKICEWCGMKMKEGLTYSSRFPLCESNPLVNSFIIKLIEKGETDEPK